MTPPKGSLLEFDELESTQKTAIDLILKGEIPGVIFAHHQSQGKGRFDRSWFSQSDDSLTATLVFDSYADHPKPWLIGMVVATVIAATLNTQLQWPNDITAHGKKLGGILTSIVTDQFGRRIPIVGVGLNINQSEFPSEILDRATSLLLLKGARVAPAVVLTQILDNLASAPEPDGWDSIAPIWMLFDETPGKPYRLSDGADAVALGLGPDGQLICSVAGETQSVMAADAIFGDDETSK